MATPRDTWRTMSPLARTVAVGGLVAAAGALALGGAFAAGAIGRAAPSEAADIGIGPAASPFGASASALPPIATLGPGVSPSASPSPTPPGTDPLLGTDGRLTVLLLGSDYRPAHPGNRTDAIMVVSIDPTTGAVAAFSVPRDTTGFPLPGGGTFSPKVNALYQQLQSTTGNGGKAMENAIAKAFGIEIDGSVFIGFAGVRQLIDAIGGVDVTLPQAYFDPVYWVNSHRQGWGLPAGTSHLDGATALIMARSRHGDNDFGRTRRQQLLVMAALTKLRTLGVGALPTLLRIAASTVRTDLPVAQGALLFKLFITADLAHAKRTVFGPKTYASGVAGGSFSLKLDVCRAWIAANFPPIRPDGTWTPAT
jgi:polyisoprenyl-teichoic acid--peptidoglycan teichoic acid transferase